jgi:uncharacterized protein (TIRG00374 family)
LFSDRRFWLGIIVTAVFLVVLFWQLDLDELASALAGANYLYVIPAVAVYFGSLYFRSQRWSFLLRPFQLISSRRLYPVVAVGYMANNLLPVRLGELVRSYYLAQREQVRATTALATIVVERVFDGMALLFLLAVAALFLPVAGLADRVSGAVRLPVALVAVVVAVPFAVALTMIVGAALYPIRFRATVAFFTRRLPRGVGTKSDILLERFVEGFQGLHRPGRLAEVFLRSLPIWLAEGAMYYLIALGFGLDVYFDTVLLMVAAVLMVTAVSNLATSLPSSQGSVGPFEFFAVLTLEAFGVGTALAAAYALVLHAALLLPVIAVGLIHLGASSISLHQLLRGGASSIKTQTGNQS